MSASPTQINVTNLTTTKRWIFVTPNEVPDTTDVLAVVANAWKSFTLNPSDHRGIAFGTSYAVGASFPDGDDKDHSTALERIEIGQACQISASGGKADLTVGGPGQPGMITALNTSSEDVSLSFYSDFSMISSLPGVPKSEMVTYIPPAGLYFVCSEPFPSPFLPDVHPSGLSPTVARADLSAEVSSLRVDLVEDGQGVRWVLNPGRGVGRPCREGGGRGRHAARDSGQARRRDWGEGSVRCHLKDGRAADPPIPPLIATASPVVEGRRYNA